MNYIPRSSYSPGVTPSAIPQQIKKKRIVHVFAVIGWVVFAVAISGLAGSFLYKDAAFKKLNTAKKELVTISENKDDTAVEKIRAFNNRFESANKLITNHLSMYDLLSNIERVTKENVGYKVFTYKYDPGFSATLSLKGSADSLNSVAFQKRKYESSGMFSAFKLSGVNFEDKLDSSDKTQKVAKGREVVFSVDGILKTDSVKYRGNRFDALSTTTILDDSDVVDATSTDTLEGGSASSSSSTTTP